MHVLVICKYKKDWIKNNWEKVETSFSPLYINGGFLLSLKPVLIQSAPKPYAAFTRTPLLPPPPPPNDMLHIKFDQDWPTGFRDIQIRKCKIFVIQGQVTPVSSLIRRKIELVWAFMPVLVTSNFDDDSIKNERSSMETAFSHYKSMGNFLDDQGQLTS